MENPVPGVLTGLVSWSFADAVRLEAEWKKLVFSVTGKVQVGGLLFGEPIDMEETFTIGGEMLGPDVADWEGLIPNDATFGGREWPDLACADATEIVEVAFGGSPPGLISVRLSMSASVRFGGLFRLDDDTLAKGLLVQVTGVSEGFQEFALGPPRLRTEIHTSGAGVGPDVMPAGAHTLLDHSVEFRKFTNDDFTETETTLTIEAMSLACTERYPAPGPI
jgi:hypothetical protein